MLPLQTPSGGGTVLFLQEIGFVYTCLLKPEMVVGEERKRRKKSRKRKEEINGGRKGVKVSSKYIGSAVSYHTVTLDWLKASHRLCPH